MVKRYIHFVSLGCAKNRVDTEVMAGLATGQGLRLTADPRQADIIVVNTCAFIESARCESIEVLLQMARHRIEGRARYLVAAGCLAQRHGAELGQEIPELSHLLGTGRPDRLGRIIAGRAARYQVGPAGCFLQKRRTPRFSEPGAASAFIKIADGCSRRCAFCAIPGIKGRGRSRPIDDIVREAQQLGRRGIKEICLVAQDTSAYGRDLSEPTDLAALLRALDAVKAIDWIRLLYLYPDTVNKRLLRAMRESSRVVPYLDIPIQHASGAVLRRMRRGHGPERLRRLIESVREEMPGAFLRTTVLVGHPGESEEDFAELMHFLQWAEPDHLGAFRYSDEEGTASYNTGPAVPPRLSYQRLRQVMALGRRLSRERNRGMRGERIEVLVEGAADEQGWVLVGRHAGQAPEVDGVTYLVSCEAQRGERIQGRVIKTGPYDLVVEPV